MVVYKGVLSFFSVTMFDFSRLLELNLVIVWAENHSFSPVFILGCSGLVETD